MGADHVEMKHLATRREQAERRLKALREELSVLDQKIRTETNEISRIDAQVAQLQAKARNSNKAVVFTEHAILRYLERVKGIDIEKTKREMVPEAVSYQIKALGNGEYPAGTHSVKVKDNTVITILTKEENPPQKPQAVQEGSPAQTLLDVPKPGGTFKCLKCEEPTERLLKGGLCQLCVQEGYALE